MKYEEKFERDLFQDFVPGWANIFGNRYDDVIVGVPRSGNGRNGTHPIIVYMRHPVKASRDSARGIIQDEMESIAIPLRR